MIVEVIFEMLQSYLVITSGVKQSPDSNKTLGMASPPLSDRDDTFYFTYASQGLSLSTHCCGKPQSVKRGPH